MMFIFGMPGTTKLKLSLILRAGIRELIPFYSKRFVNSKLYWKDRYKFGGNSGKGSRGKIAQEKAEYMNSFCRRNNIETIVEFGCGDGVCASMLDAARYIGFDISDTALKFARDRCPDENRFRFFNSMGLMSDEINKIVLENRLPGKLVNLSMDVIFHLVEDDVFKNYLDIIAGAPGDFVVIRSSDIDGAPKGHYRARAYSKILTGNYGLKLLESHTSQADIADSAYHFKTFGR